mmetsp:Transcript_7423/g.22852  ORF Transcript_7423/g.22852 Transcript_7423/m.22852 type:complete len:263 (+) Transcript_7423:1530-2318(+)
MRSPTCSPVSTWILTYRTRSVKPVFTMRFVDANHRWPSCCWHMAPTVSYAPSTVIRPSIWRCAIRIRRFSVCSRRRRTPTSNTAEMQPAETAALDSVLQSARGHLPRAHVAAGDENRRCRAPYAHTTDSRYRATKSASSHRRRSTQRWTASTCRALRPRRRWPRLAPGERPTPICSACWSRRVPAARTRRRPTPARATPSRGCRNSCSPTSPPNSRASNCSGTTTATRVPVSRPHRTGSSVMRTLPASTLAACTRRFRNRNR